MIAEDRKKKLLPPLSAKRRNFVKEGITILHKKSKRYCTYRNYHLAVSGKEAAKDSPKIAEKYQNLFFGLCQSFSMCKDGQ